jgi:hypothetical protein
MLASLWPTSCRNSHGYAIFQGAEKERQLEALAAQKEELLLEKQTYQVSICSSTFLESSPSVSPANLANLVFMHVCPDHAHVIVQDQLRTAQSTDEKRKKDEGACSLGEALDPSCESVFQLNWTTLRSSLRKRKASLSRSRSALWLHLQRICSPSC